MVDLLEGIAWLGHASFRITAPEGVIYIDPWKLGASAPPADLILITHHHSDHYSPDDVGRLLKPDTVVVTTAEVAGKFKGNVQVVKPGDTVTAAGMQVEAVAAYNPDKQFHPKQMGGVGFIVTAGGRRIYHSGDTDLIPEMAACQADVALLPVGGKYTMSATEAAQAAERVNAQVAVPMHWGEIIGSREDAEAFKAACKTRVEILERE